MVTNGLGWAGIKTQLLLNPVTELFLTNQTPWKRRYCASKKLWSLKQSQVFSEIHPSSLWDKDSTVPSCFYPWRYLKAKMWLLRTLSSGGVGSAKFTVGLSDPKGLFQHKWSQILTHHHGSPPLIWTPVPLICVIQLCTSSNQWVTFPWAKWRQKLVKMSLSWDLLLPPCASCLAMMGTTSILQDIWHQT